MPNGGPVKRRAASVLIRGALYESNEESGNKTLSRYNEKHKVWVRLNFCQNNGENSITGVLAKQYVRKMI